jgi:glyoxylase-like metal-dependent hydrolase (beta-lactamase superfamily II)
MKKTLKKWLDKHNLKLILLTHAHIDHVWNTKYLKDLYHCEVAISKDDYTNIDNRNIKTKPLTKKLKTWSKIMSFGMKKFIPKTAIL